MQRLIFAFIAGGLFGAGLFVSGMTDTTKVQGWLDVFGNWDPTLAFVMGGAMIPMGIAWLFTRDRKPLVGGMNDWLTPGAAGAGRPGVRWGLCRRGEAGLQAACTARDTLSNSIGSRSLGVGNAHICRETSPGFE